MVKTGRLLTTALAVWSCGLTATSQAQGPSPAGEVVTLPAGASGHSYSSGAFGDSGPYAPSPGGSAAYCPPPGSAEYCPPGGVPVEKPWWEKQPLWIHPGLLAPPRGAFVRTEYLLWEIEEPGDVLLGSMPEERAFDSPDRDFDQGYYSNALFDENFDPTDGYIVRNPEIEADADDEFFFEDDISFNYVPRMTELQLRDNSGIRTTLGIPTYEYGTIELSGWMLEQASDEYRFGGRQLVPPNDFEFREFNGAFGYYTEDDFGGAFTDVVFVNGDTFHPSTSVNVNTGSDFVSIPYDYLDVAYRSDLWGADAKFVVDALAPEGEGLKIRPLIGFKYVGLQEAMYQRGFRQLPGTPADISSINSDTTNTYLGGTIGLRTELEHRWFTAGLEPAVTFAGNIAEASVTSERFTQNFHPHRHTSSSYFDFAPILELDAYVRVKLHDNCRFTVGYDAMWLSRVFRASRVIDYRVSDEGPQGLPSNVDTKNVTDHVAVEGLSLGLEFVF